jgi:protein ImuA
VDDFPLAAPAVPAAHPAPAPPAAGLFDPPEEPPLETLHPALWRADQLGRPREAGVGSGYPELDRVLPGCGWPARALTELLLPHAGLGEMRLLAPALAALQQQGRSVMLFDPPALPAGWTLAAQGLDVNLLYVVQSRSRGARAAGLPAADLLWALEQALKSGHVGAVLAWLPARLGADALRRLQLAAQVHDGPAFLLRDETLRSKPSPAPLRLLLRPGGADALRVQILKRRGPPLAQPLVLALAPVLSAAARARAERAAAAPSTVHPEEFAS